MITNCFGWAAATVRRVADSDPSFPRFLLHQSPLDRQCMITAILGWERSEPGRMSLPELGKRLQTGNKKALLRRLHQPCPKGLTNALEKLGDRVLAKNRYFDLIELLAEPQAAKVLWHLPKIKPLTIETLKALPIAFRTRPIVETINDREQLKDLLYVVTASRKLEPDRSDRQIAASVEQAIKDRPDETDLAEPFNATGWLCKRLAKAQFPPPPWPGNAKLHPLTNPKDLLQTAEKFENCLGRLLHQVIGGRQYFYLWKGDRPAVAALDQDLIVGWVVGDICGPKNNQVSHKTRDAILVEFGAAGFHKFDCDLFNLGW